MKINNSLLLSFLLRDCPQAASSILQTVAYIYVYKGRSCLILRCPNMAIASVLLYYQGFIASRLESLLSYEVQLELSVNAIEESNMIAVAERTTQANTPTENRLLNIETLVRATNTSIQDVKLLLAQANAPIYPQVDGTEAISEPIFDEVLLNWAKGLKLSSDQPKADQSASEAPTKPRKAAPKVLISELTESDIIKIKTGKTSGSPNMTQKGIAETLENFFNKVRLEDTAKVDAVSAFIEGTSEFGINLRKKLLAAYKKFTKANLQEAETKLVEGAKNYLENLASTAAED
ncbi:hypothetical protein [Anabaena sp. CCY 9910]|uniref:hypothetical protein n=1 Tax=Anabaena sp. CCY 9910 TaxID=3103870 RepID=UPI0039E088CD